MLPPYTVFKADNLWSTWMDHGPEGARYNRTKSGWFDKNIFEDEVFSIIIPYAKKLNGPLILIGDNLDSHVSLRVITECREKNINFIPLPPNNTHLTQPLDVSVFRPLKEARRKLLHIHKQKYKGATKRDIFIHDEENSRAN
ncbi:hypothetical protein NQ314_008576 [Rhamnusium bicolor]|uniref:DDE-1 domain-containing protein n=1 Tax=Rhamnusium bicolor TaxID=1586634 RepID=A0AAV8Y9N6_9CUCU|nr:hypothetical protein NQ314_008576 [Rhamnusium bicolor]